ncbi:hypothetical protein [Vulgatibacter sp.]|uniref:hypothetical protein n=1 Tax=Vulgatibacter sp. TaxID=1971226 RepID=UPI0035695969
MTDHFQQFERPGIDTLFVVDDSAAMRPHRTALALWAKDLATFEQVQGSDGR